MKLTLKALRANANLTQEQVAEKIGVSAPTWSKWENGIRYPNIVELQKIEKLFEVNYDDINFLPK